MHMCIAAYLFMITKIMAIIGVRYIIWQRKILQLRDWFYRTCNAKLLLFYAMLDMIFISDKQNQANQAQSRACILSDKNINKKYFLHKILLVECFINFFRLKVQ